MTTQATTEIQVAAAVADPRLPVPPGLTSARGTPDRLRFAVYRNNVHVSLVEALAKAFPVTLRLVGEEFFRAMARAYVSEHKPESPVLIRYGTGFPDFIGSFPPAGRLTYLPDLARLEHAWLEAYHAAEAEPLDAEILNDLAPDRFADMRLAPHPAARLVASTHAIGSVWAAHQARDVKPVRVDLPETVLVTRPHAQVRATILPATDVRFVRHLMEGSSIGDAAAAAHARDPGFDAGKALTGLLTLGAFTRFPFGAEAITP